MHGAAKIAAPCILKLSISNYNINKMKTKTQKKKDAIKPNVVPNNALNDPAMQEGIQMTINLSEIELSQLNYRRTFNEADLAEFAKDLARHGIISPVTVRKMPSGRYELVVGERRYRAAHLAQLIEVPAMVRELTDEQVIELQLAENMQREDPHPLHESKAVAILLHSGKTIEEVALRLGKSKAFVYNRIKLSELIDPVQQMFLADKITIQQAIEIAGLSTSSQEEFFEAKCAGWQADHFQFYNLQYLLSHYRYDLKNAPFDIEDKNLLPEAGACTGCPFNSATLKSLFPDLAKEANCTNKSCFIQKCQNQSILNISTALAQHEAVAFLSYGSVSEEYQKAIDAIPEAKNIPQYDYYNVYTMTAPPLPDKEDYVEDGDDEEGEPIFNQEDYEQAMEEYRTDMAEFEADCAGGRYLKGLILLTGKIGVIWFDPEKKKSNQNTGLVSAKDVQEAIKNGTVTIDLFKAEMQRINSREVRAKELDAEKIQIELHKQFGEALNTETLTPGLTDADLTAVRLFVFQSLDWSSRRHVESILFAEKEDHDDDSKTDRLTELANLSDEQFAYLIRCAVVAKSESKVPKHINAHCLYQVAQQAGLDVAAIEQQQDKTTEREERLAAKIKELEKKIKQLQLKEAA